VGGASSLTALTRLRISQQWASNDPRLQLPHIQALDVEEMMSVADPAVWQQLQDMPDLQQLNVGFSGHNFSTTDCPGMLGGLTGLQRLRLDIPPGRWEVDSPQWKPWVAAVACLTRLEALQVPGPIVVVGGAALLAALTQLKELTVHFMQRAWWGPMQEVAAKAAATLMGDVVQVVAGAVQGGKGTLQRLVLHADGVEEDVPVQQAVAAAQATLPMLLVEAGWECTGQAFAG
jgi:hypothetical protein